MSDTLVEIDVFDPIYRAADEAGIDLEEARLLPTELTDNGDLTVRIEEQEEEPIHPAICRRIAIKAVTDHGLTHRAAADLVNRSQEWVSKQVAEERGRDE